MTSFAHRVLRYGWVISLTCGIASPLVAQRINFGAYTTARGITLNVSGALNFNDKQSVIASGSNTTVTINLNDNAIQYVEITGDATRDVTVTVSAPTNLSVGAGGPGNQIPFACQFAYSNVGSATVAAAKTAAVQVPAGFTAITFPVLKRLAGTPLPPPTPAHGGYTPPAATAYVFFYGALGPVGNVSPGIYSGTVNVSVQY